MGCCVGTDCIHVRELTDRINKLERDKKILVQGCLNAAERFQTYFQIHERKADAMDPATEPDYQTVYNERLLKARDNEKMARTLENIVERTKSDA